jgi:hypothetical protein
MQNPGCTTGEPPREGCLDRIEVRLGRIEASLSDGDVPVPLTQCRTLLSEYLVAYRDSGAGDAQLSHEGVKSLVQSGILGLDRGRPDR